MSIMRRAVFVFLCAACSSGSPPAQPTPRDGGGTGTGGRVTVDAGLIGSGTLDAPASDTTMTSPPDAPLPSLDVSLPPDLAPKLDVPPPPPCSLRFQDCPDGLACYPDDRGSTVCAAAGNRVGGAPCVSHTQCEKTSVCVGECREICEVGGNSCVGACSSLNIVAEARAGWCASS